MREVYSRTKTLYIGCMLLRCSTPRRSPYRRREVKESLMVGLHPNYNKHTNSEEVD